MPRKILAVLFLVAAGLGTWFALGTGERTVTNNWEACQAHQYDCRKEAFAAALKRTDPRKLAETVALVFEEDPRRAPGCHQVMHEIGQAMSSRSDRTAMGELWSRCGYGMLHGLYETLDLPEDPQKAGALAYAECDGNEEVAAVRDLAARCEHALGHSLWRAMGSNPEKAAEACLVTEDRFAYENCLSGVFMMDRETNWKGRPAPQTTEDWKEALSGCSDLTLLSCVLTHAETAVFDSVASARGWLDFCLNVTDARYTPADSKRCVYLLAQSQTFVQEGGKDTDTTVAQCALWTNGLPQLVREGCLQGALNALAANGVPEQERRNRACKLLEGTDLSC